VSPAGSLTAKLTITGSTSGAVSELKKLEAGFKQVHDGLQKFDAGLRGLQRIAGIGFGALAGGFTLVAREGLKALSTVGSLTRGFETLLKSKAEADKLTADLLKFAATSPLKIEDIGSATKYLLLQGEAVSGLTDKWKIFSDVVSALSTAQEPMLMQEVAEFYERAKAGALRAPMLLRFGISKQELKEYGVQFDEMGQVIKEAGITTEAASKQIGEAILRIFRDTFAGATELKLATAGGMLQELKNTLTPGLALIGKEVNDQWKRILKSVREALAGLTGDPEIMAGLKAGAKALGDLLEPLVTAGTGKLAQLAARLKEHPEALAESANKLTFGLKALGVILAILVGASGLVRLVDWLVKVAFYCKAAAVVINTSLIPALGRLGVVISGVKFTTIASGIASLGPAIASVATAAANAIPLLAALAAAWELYNRMKGGPQASYARESATSAALALELGGPAPGIPWDVGQMLAGTTSNIGALRLADLALDRARAKLPRGRKILTPAETEQKAAEDQAAKDAREKLEAGLRSFLPPQYNIISSWYDSLRKGGIHGGVDFPAPAGTPVKTIGEMTVKAIYNTYPGSSKDKGVVLVDAQGNYVALHHVTNLRDALGRGLVAGDILKDKTAFADLVKQKRPHLDVKVMSAAVGQAWEAAGFAGQPWRKGQTFDPLTAGYFGPPTGEHAASVKFGWQAAAASPVMKAFEDARNEVDQMTRKLAVYREMVQQGTLSQARLTDEETKYRQILAGLYEKLKISLSAEDFTALQEKYPEIFAKMEAASKELVSTERVEGLKAAMKTAEERFNALAAQVDSLRGALRGLEDAYSSLRASHARMKGFTLEAVGIEYDAEMRRQDRAREDLERYREENAKALAAREPGAVAQEAQLVAQGLEAMKGLVDMVTGLKAQEGMAPYAKEMEAALGPAYEYWAAQGEQAISAGEVQLVAAQQLVQAGADLKGAAGWLQAAASALMNAAGQISAAQIAAATAAAAAAIQGTAPAIIPPGTAGAEPVAVGSIGAPGYAALGTAPALGGGGTTQYFWTKPCEGPS